MFMIEVHGLATKNTFVDCLEMKVDWQKLNSKHLPHIDIKKSDSRKCHFWAIQHVFGALARRNMVVIKLAIWAFWDLKNVVEFN